jgi:hypothetical protein
MRDEADTQEYQCVMLNCYLYVKVSKMSDAIYKEFHSRFLSGKEKLLYQFRRMNIKELHFPNGSFSFNSADLFPDSEVPSKIFFVCVFNDSKNGKQTKNPYNFWRKFKLVKNLDTAENLSGALEAQYIKENLELQMAKMKFDMVNSVEQMKKSITDDIQNALRVQFEGLQQMMRGVAGATPPGSTPTNSTPTGSSGITGLINDLITNKGPPGLIKRSTRTRTTTQQNQQPILRDDDTRSEVSSEFEDAIGDPTAQTQNQGQNTQGLNQLGQGTSRSYTVQQQQVLILSTFLHAFNYAAFLTNIFLAVFSSYVWLGTKICYKKQKHLLLIKLTAESKLRRFSCYN